MKKCTKCKKNKEANLDNFPPKGKYLGSWCRICLKDYHSELYKRDPERKKALLARNEKAEEDLKKKVMDYLKDHPCVKCGESNPIVLDFDHLRDKEFEIARAVMDVYSWKTVSKEIEKCQVLCANCHRIKTAEQLNTWKFKYLGSPSPTGRGVTSRT